MNRTFVRTVRNRKMKRVRVCVSLSGKGFFEKLRFTWRLTRSFRETCSFNFVLIVPPSPRGKNPPLTTASLSLSLCLCLSMNSIVHGIRAGYI